jgi:REP element-mobilizing transposase RayT
MSRPLRFVPRQETLVEVSTRTVQNRFLLRPSPAMNEIVAGILGRAQELYGVGICGFAFLSNHYHLLLRVDDAKQLSGFMTHFNSNLAREAGRLVGWPDKFWSRRYRSIVISGEEGAQRERLKYVLAHGAKEGLVASPRQWPGVHAVRALLDGEPVQGYWFDRTQEYAARRRGEEPDRLRYAKPYTVALSPLPCWQDLQAEEQKERLAEVGREIEEEAAARRAATGITPPGPDAIRRQQPHERPVESKKSPAPLVHAVTKRVRDDLRAAYYAFVGAFREAAAKLRGGDLKAIAQFPAGSFPPALPFQGG